MKVVIWTDWGKNGPILKNFIILIIFLICILSFQEFGSFKKKSADRWISSALLSGELLVSEF